LNAKEAKKLEVNDKFIESIVEEVLKKLSTVNIIAKPACASKGKGIFQNIDDAIESATISQKKFKSLSLEKRFTIIEAIRTHCRANANMLGEMAVKETGLGKVKDKIQKNLLAINKTPGPEDITPGVYTGDCGLTLVEQAPYGVIGSITPCTNPSETVINNSISMLSAGNGVVFNPHPAAKEVSAKAVEIINEAIVSAGGPENLVTTVLNPTLDTASALMKHPGIKMLVVTGGGEVVKAAMSSGKKVIAAGPGNPPVVVDETAEIPKAARDIVSGASFDNNVLCIAEKEVFVVAAVADELKRFMCNVGAIELAGKDARRLIEEIIDPASLTREHPYPRKQYVGKSPSFILKSIGINVPEEVLLVIVEVERDNPLIGTEQLMPILPIVRVRDVDEAISEAIKAEHYFGHTAMMHSKNIENLSKMAQLINTTIFVKNAPSYAGLGMGGEGFTSFTIAGPTGEGVTSARTFTRQRRCVLVDYFRII